MNIVIHRTAKRIMSDESVSLIETVTQSGVASTL
jgi:hypothetical protein